MKLKRRDFIRVSGISAAGAIVLPPLFQSCKGPVLSDNAASYLDHFEVTPGLLQKVIRTAMSKGGDYADLFFEHTLSNYSNLEDGKVNQAYSNIGYGVGIRVLKGDQTGYSFTEIITPDAMLKAANTAANIANGTGTSIPLNISEFIVPNLYPVKTSWENTSINNKIPFLERVNEKVFAGDKKVTKVNASIGDTSSYIPFLQL